MYVWTTNGVALNGEIQYVVAKVPFGLKSAVKLFATLADAIE